MGAWHQWTLGKLWERRVCMIIPDMEKKKKNVLCIASEKRKSEPVYSVLPWLNFSRLRVNVWNCVQLLLSFLFNFILFRFLVVWGLVYFFAMGASFLLQCIRSQEVMYITCAVDICRHWKIGISRRDVWRGICTSFPPSQFEVCTNRSSCTSFFAVISERSFWIQGVHEVSNWKVPSLKAVKLA